MCWSVRNLNGALVVKRWHGLLMRTCGRTGNSGIHAFSMDRHVLYACLVAIHTINYGAHRLRAALLQGACEDKDHGPDGHRKHRHCLLFASAIKHPEHRLVDWFILFGVKLLHHC